MFSRMRRTAVIGGVLLAATMIAAGCGDDDDSATGNDGNLKGAVTIDGSSTVFPIVQALAEEFRGEHSDVEVSVGTSGTGGGFEKFCRGETDIANASRPVEDDEKAACEAKGIEFVELPIATDGLSIVVNPANDDVDCLTTAQLKSIWEPSSTIKDWSDIDDSFGDRQLALYGPGTDSGTFDYFTDVVNGEEGASRSDYTASEDDNVLVQGVAGDEGALGYFGYGYYEANQDKLKLVKVDAGKGCIEPTTETIDSGEYEPLSRPLFMYVSRKAADTAQVAAFVDFALENAAGIVGDVGFVKASDDAAKTASDNWATFVDDAA